MTGKANQWRWARTYTVAFDGRHLRVARRDGRSVHCVWDVLQRIKNDVAGPDVSMVEVFPAATDLVDEVNVRHLWVVDHQDLRFGWVRTAAGFARVMV